MAKKLLKKSRKKVSKKKVEKKAAPKKKIVKKVKKKPVPRKKVVKKAKLKPKKARKPVKKELPKKKKVKEEPEKPKMPSLAQKEEMKKIIAILGDAYIRQVLIEVGGENALAIVRNFYGNHSDEELAKKLKIKISDVRATLNKLHNEGLVNYIRQKDNETGWYSYSWSLNHGRMEKWANDQANKIPGMDDSEGENYYCPACGASTITGFEDAVVGDFRCAHCNRMLEFLDSAKMVEIFERRRLQ